MRIKQRLIPALLILLSAALTNTATAASCQTGNFESWLEDFKREAAGQGISHKAISSALDGLTFDDDVLKHDRSQQVFKQTFEQFSGRMISAYRLQMGAKLIRKHAEIYARIEKEFGVPAPIITAIWGLETDFGAYNGKFSTIRAIVTLAYDCRRSDRFRAELLDALRIVDKGDMAPADMRGAWAGEIGQTQFMPSSYIKFAVDFDGDGKSDLIHSVPDVLASTANFLRGYGWKRGEGWGEGSKNFQVIKEWNKSDIYSRTIALLATRLAEGQQTVGRISQ
jgi:lytic murein transglycosylase